MRREALASYRDLVTERHEGVRLLCTGIVCDLPNVPFHRMSESNAMVWSRYQFNTMLGVRLYVENC